jgi:hypothetical protein
MTFGDCPETQPTKAQTVNNLLKRNKVTSNNEATKLKKSTP